MADSSQKLPQREAGIFKKIVVSASASWLLHRNAARMRSPSTMKRWQLWWAPNRVTPPQLLKCEHYVSIVSDTSCIAVNWCRCCTV